MYTFVLSRSTIETKWSSSRYLGFCFQNTQAALSKAPKVITEQPLGSSSAEPSSKYCCLCTTLSKEVVQSRKKTGEAVGKKAGQKQEEAEELGCEHTLQNRELVIDNTKSNKCVSTERYRTFLGENTTQKTPLWTDSCIWGQKACCSWNRSECNFHHSISYWDYSLGLNITLPTLQPSAKIKWNRQQSRYFLHRGFVLADLWSFLIFFLIYILLKVNIFPFMCFCLIINGWTFWDFWQI